MTDHATMTAGLASPPAPGTVSLPAGPLARLLYGLCRQGPAPEPTKVSNGWATYRWTGLDGDEGVVELRTASHPEHTDDDELAAGALRRAATQPRAGIELAVMLARAVELDGAEGQWRWARVTEVLHGKRAKTDRHNGPVQAWLALFERGRWHLAPGSRPAGKTKSTTVVAGAALASIERHSACSATLGLHPGVARQLGAERHDVAATTLELAAACPNPEGNNPSRAVRARARLAAIFAADADAGDIKVEDLMAHYGALDLDPVARRRHTPGWTDHVVEELTAGLAAIGRQLAQAPQRARRALATVVRFARSTTQAGAATTPPPPGRPPPPSGGPAPGRLGTARASRAP